MISVLTLFCASCTLFDGVAQRSVYPFDQVNEAQEYKLMEGAWEHDQEDYFGWEIPAPGPKIVYLHGNGESLSALGSGFLQKLSKYGHLFVLEYTGIEPVPGTPNQQELETAATAMYQYVESVYEGRYPIYVIGRSLGAAVAAQVASLMKPTGLLLISPWTTLDDVASEKSSLWGLVSSRWKKANEWNSLWAVSQYSGRIGVIHGASDTLIPTKFGIELANSVTSDLTLIEGRGHNDLFADDKTWEAIGNFLKGE